MGPPGPSGLLLGEAPGPGQRCLFSVVFVHASPDSPHRGVPILNPWLSRALALLLQHIPLRVCLSVPHPLTPSLLCLWALHYGPRICRNEPPMGPNHDSDLRCWGLWNFLCSEA